MHHSSFLHCKLYSLIKTLQYLNRSANSLSGNHLQWAIWNNAAMRYINDIFGQVPKVKAATRQIIRIYVELIKWNKSIAKIDFLWCAAIISTSASINVCFSDFEVIVWRNICFVTAAWHFKRNKKMKDNFTWRSWTHLKCYPQKKNINTDNWRLYVHDFKTLPMRIHVQRWSCRFLSLLT